MHKEVKKCEECGAPVTDDNFTQCYKCWSESCAREFGSDMRNSTRILYATCLLISAAVVFVIYIVNR